MAMEGIRKTVEEKVEEAWDMVKGLRARVLGSDKGAEQRDAKDEKSGPPGSSDAPNRDSAADQGKDDRGLGGSIAAARDKVVQTLGTAIDKAGDAVSGLGTPVGAPDEEPTDALMLLARDHRLVDGLFERLMALPLGQRESREGLFAQLLYELDAHASAEEKLFYPRLEHDPANKTLIAEALAEHQSVKQLLAELSSSEFADLSQGSKNGEVWRGKLKALQDQVKHHVREEETQIFPRARQLINEAELKALMVRIQEAKRAQTQLSQEKGEVPQRPA